jgi:alpha-1,3-glucosyltransferase
MHGDFEAQRHWMEITSHLPVSAWYFYDLPYWGLDYPPLTAYHSYILGKVGSLINPSWFAVDVSRGIESPLLKVYMRATVLISEYIVYMPAAVILTRRQGHLLGVSTWESSVALAAILLQPSTMLIDHAHFQYNTVMLGFVLASMSSLFAGRLLWGCVFFVAALCFKQMALYFAPAMFAYLLGTCLNPRLQPGRLLAIAIVTAFSFAAMFAPLLLGSVYNRYHDPSSLLKLEPPYLYTLLHSALPSSINSAVENIPFLYPILLQLTQSIHRIFPLARGLFEDKVANIPFTFHTLILKLHAFPTPVLSRLSLLATLIAILPSSLLICSYPRRNLLPWALACSGWGFFLCSFQVHEKSVLLPLLPMTVLLGAGGGLGREIRAWVGFANTLGAWTMFPLLVRDELRVPYFVLALLWAYLLGLPPTSFSLYTFRSTTNAKGHGLWWPIKLIHLAFYLVMAVWHLLEAFVSPPSGKPDLWVVLNCLVGCAGFVVCAGWCNWQLIVRSGVLDEWFDFREKIDRMQGGSAAAGKATDMGTRARVGTPGSKKTR